MGYVVAADDVRETRASGDTASTRVTIDRSAGCERLEQRVVAYHHGRSQPRRLDGRQEVLYVAGGRGTIEINGRTHPLEPESGVYVAGGDEYVVENAGPETLTLVVVDAPEERAASADDERRVVRFADQEPLPASPNREFRYLVNQDIGCPDVTQFVGLIPPGKAGMHSHTYDEVVYVLDGEGVLHLGGKETPLARGTCIHLPPLEEHCLENTGPTPMRVLGVFHPSGDPASRAYEESRSGNNAAPAAS